jgi:hypothetical protein
MTHGNRRPAHAPQQALAPPLHAILAEVTATLDTIGMYRGNFDGQGAEAPVPAAVQNARRLVEEALYRVGMAGGPALKPYSIAPLPNSHIFLEWEAANGSLEIEVRPDDTHGYLLVRHEGEQRHFSEGEHASRDEVIAMLRRLLVSEVVEGVTGAGRS